MESSTQTPVGGSTDKQNQTDRMEALGRFAGAIAHDFNNILTAILSFAGFVRDDLAPSDPRREDVIEILRAADRGATLIRQLLTFSKLQSHAPQDIKVADILNQVYGLARRLVSENVEISLVCAEQPQWVNMDPHQLEQVMLNLIINARDAMPNGGNLSIVEEHNEQQRKVCVRVQDSGVGMPAEVMEKIFEPFFSTKGSKGTGLGLATSYGIVKQAGGDIEVESQVGEGTVFRVYLPEVESQTGVVSQRNRNISQVYAGTETILLVEDDEVVRRVACRTLEAAGYRVLCTEEGSNAERVFAENMGEIDCLLTDVIMPHLNGCELAQRLCAQSDELVVVLMTGYADSVDAELNFPLISKPFVQEELLRAVRTALDKSNHQEAH